MSSKDAIQRSILPIPDIQPFGLTTYDAKDPDTRFPPIRELRPPKGAPNVLVILIDDVGFGASSAFGGPCNTPNFEKLAKSWVEVQPFPYHGAMLADAAGAPDGSQPSLRGHGRHHRDRDVCSRLQLCEAEHQGAAGRNAQAQRLLDRAIRQVPRSSRLADKPGRSVRCLAERWRRL